MAKDRIEKQNTEGEWRRATLREDGLWHKESGRVGHGGFRLTHDVWRAPVETKREAEDWCDGVYE